MSSEKVKRPRLTYNHLRPDITSSETINHLRSSWAKCDSNDSASFNNIGVNVIQHPFPVCVIQDFISNVDLLKSAVDELNQVPFFPKNNDLYQFEQSDDVLNLKQHNSISQLYDVLKNEVHSWLSDIFLNDHFKNQIAATFSSYQTGDRLLCHDDKCEDRHIAFVIYLTENWQEEDGGALQLFSTDKSGYPHEIVKEIFPKFNSIVLFEVTPTSFHQVAEVLSKNKKRLSLNGWFHSEGKNLQSANCVALELKETLPNDKEYTLEDYFLYNYLEFNNQLDIKGSFISDSEIQLDEFIVPSFWEEINAALKNDNVKWNFVGPANIKNYEVVKDSTLPTALKTIKEILESKSWLKYLRAITGLDFVPSTTSDLDVWNQGKQPVCNIEIQKWTRGCYTLIHDKDPEFHSNALDVFLRFPFDENSDDDEDDDDDNDDDLPEAGHIIYIDKDSKDDECLLHIGYKMNSLALIYRDTKTLKFVKYLDAKAKSFYQISCTYRSWSPPPDKPELRHCESDSDDENAPSEGSHYGEEESEEENDTS